jgi:hypothetical protein
MSLALPLLHNVIPILRKNVIPAKAGIDLSVHSLPPDWHDSRSHPAALRSASSSVPVFPTDQVRGLKAHGTAILG